MPAGKGRAQHVHRIQAGLQLALHVGNDVHHVRIVLDLHVLGHLDGADLRDAADVVAPQIHQHHMLGALLRIGQQFGRQRGIFLRGLAARARAGDRPHRHGVAFQAHQDLGRGADHMEIAEVDNRTCTATD